MSQSLRSVPDTGRIASCKYSSPTELDNPGHLLFSGFYYRVDGETELLVSSFQRRAGAEASSCQQLRCCCWRTVASQIAPA